jgi:hypothetical protein
MVSFSRQQSAIISFEGFSKYYVENGTKTEIKTLIQRIVINIPVPPTNDSWSTKLEEELDRLSSGPSKEITRVTEENADNYFKFTSQGRILYRSEAENEWDLFCTVDDFQTIW